MCVLGFVDCPEVLDHLGFSLSLFKMLHLLSHQKPLLCQIQSLLFRLYLTRLSEAWSPASPSRDTLFTSVTAHSLPPQSPWVSRYL